MSFTIPAGLPVHRPHERGTARVGVNAVKAVRVGGIAVTLAVGSLGVASPAWASVTWQDPPTDVSVAAAETYSFAEQLARPDRSYVVI